MLSARVLLVALIGAATATFGVGVSIERSDSRASEGETVEHVEATEAESGHAEAEEGEEAHAEGEASESVPHDEAAEDESIFGVDVEATPFVILTAAISLALALAAWLRPTSGALLALVALAMVAFAVLDVREVAHQLDESETGLAVLAGVVAALHLAAAATAFALRRQASQPA